MEMTTSRSSTTGGASTTTPPPSEGAKISAEVKAAIIVTAIFVVFASFFLWVYCQIRKHRQRDSGIETSKESQSQQLPSSRKVSSAVTGKVNLAYEMDNINQNNAVICGYFPLKYEIDDTYKPVPIDEYAAYCHTVKSNGVLQKQFASLDDGRHYACITGTDPVNLSRNRHDDIIPYDHSRVILETDKKSTDYINASLISGYVKREAYIATQGPLPSTFIDFWKMIWQYEVKSVVVLGQRIENGIIKFPLYWPTTTNTEMKYGKLTAKMKAYDKFSGYSVTSLYFLKKASTDMREVKLFHFGSWSDHEVPNKTEEIMSFREAVSNWQMDHKAPIVVHCSAGIGRTGAFIVIDAIIENITRSQVIDVYNYTNYLRSRRMFMVQTEEQFEYVHDVICAYLESLSAPVKVCKANVDDIISKMEQVVPRKFFTRFTQFFEKINRFSQNLPQQSNTESQMTQHVHKNRYADKTPLDLYRVKILATGLTLNETYINATQVSNHLFSTQAPLQSTCKDFWLMIYDSGVKNIVMLNASEEGIESFPAYFTDTTTSCGPMCITVLSEVVPVDSVIKRELLVKHKESEDDIRVIHYQVLNWAADVSPASFADLAYVVNEMQRCNASEPTVVHCNDGFGRSGCLLACSMCVEQLDEKDHVIVDHVVHHLRERNPLYISTVEQYQLIYRFLKEYFDVRYNGVTYL